MHRPDDPHPNPDAPDPADDAASESQQSNHADAASRADQPSPASHAAMPLTSPTSYLCDLCGEPMLERHCRLICTKCGYQRDCSDP